MYEDNYNFLADRYIDEVLADHYNVNDSLKSFNLLLNHIEIKTNFKFFFEKAFNQLKWKPKTDLKKLIVEMINKEMK